MKLSLLLLILVLLASTVTAFGFDVDINPIKNQITRGESADFNITFTNTLGRTNQLRLASADFIRWAIQTDPVSARLSGITLQPGESKSTILKLFPAKTVTPGRYTIQIEFSSETNSDILRKGVDVNYVSLESILRTYVPELQVTVNLPKGGKIDPRGGATGAPSIDVGVKNKNPLYLEHIVVRLKSSLFDLELPLGDLQPLERKFVTFTLDLDPHQAPKTDTLVATAVVQNITFVDLESFEIIGYTEPFEKSYSSEDSFLKHKTSIAVHNPSNIEASEAVRLETTFLPSLFTSASPKARITKEDGKRYITWHATIPANASVVLQATTNYRPFFYALILFLLGVGVYFHMRSPIILVKSVKEISKKEGGISMFKVILHVKNRSKHTIPGIEIIDRVPSIADIKRDDRPGSLQPTKILASSRKGSMAKWELESLEGKEERVLSYLVKSRLSILGTLEIPLAKARFIDSKGKRITSKSNAVKLNA